MAQIEDIQVEIEALSREKFVQLRRWFAEKDWGQWDTQLEGDAEAEKLDFFLEEAADAKAQGKLQDL